MANTYTQLYVHVVTAVKFRRRLIEDDWRVRLERQIQTTIESRGNLYLAGHAQPDHAHFLIGLHARESLADLTGCWKGTSSSFLQNEGICPGFQWQRGYGGFSVGRRELPAVTSYIHQQREIQARRAFEREYRDLLIEHDVEFEERYVLDPLI